jgi:glycosyltransferase involved in cell wall biosynthesis
VSGVTFVVYQTGAQSNGGVVSVGELIARAPLSSVRVITNRPSAFVPGWERRASVAYWRMGEGGYGERSPRLVRFFLRLANNVRMFADVRRNKTALVHVNDPQALWNTAFGAKLAGAKVLFNVRDAMRAGASRRKWRFYLRLCDCFLVLSREMERDWQERLGPLTPRDESKLRHLYSVVDPSRFHPTTDRRAVRAQLGVPEDARVLVYVGRCEPKKGQLSFIRDALPEIVRDRPDTIVYFLGDFDPENDEYAAACRAAVDHAGTARHVHFAGHTTEIADWYRAADLVLLASEREGLARCMIEGIACGAPVVSFDVCSAREVLEGHHCGVVVPLHDYRALAQATRSLLDDDARRASCAGRGSEVAARLFDPAENAAAYAALVREVAA